MSSNRLIGDDQIRQSRLGLGLAALGRPGYLTLGRGEDLGSQRDVDAMRTAAHAVLDAAHEHGIRYFDAARSYGEAERFLAAWLRERGVEPGTVTVASKWGYTYTGDWRVDADVHEVKDHSAEALERQLAESREILGEHLAIYQIHSATPDTGVLEDEGVLRRLAHLVDEGTRVGLSVSGPGQADTIRQGLDAQVDGRNPFSVVQATWNLLEPSVGSALEEARAAGWIVVVKEAVANGRLTSRNDDPAFLPNLRALQEVARRHGATVDAVAIACALAQPFADVVLSGAVTPSQVESNAAAASFTLTPDEQAALSLLAETPHAYWATRAARAWS